MQYRNFINNEFVDASATDTLTLISPVTEETLGSSPISGAEDIDRAVSAAVAAFPGWRDSTPSTRQNHLLALAQAIEDNAEELATVQTRETGQLTAFVKSEECLAGADHVRFFAGAARLLTGSATAEYMEGYTSSVRREPVGVIAQVAPWNYPLMMAIWKIAPAVAAGNTVVLKPSDTTPGSTLKLAELIAGTLPPGVINVVLGDASTGAELMQTPR